MIGKVVGIHIDDEFLTDEGKVDVVKIRPLARMGYYDYTSVDSIFTMPPLDEGEMAKAPPHRIWSAKAGAKKEHKALLLHVGRLYFRFGPPFCDSR